MWFCLYFYWRLAAKAPCIHQTSDWSTAVTSHSAVNSDACNIKIFSKYSNTLVSKRVSSCSAIRPNYPMQPPLMGFEYVGHKAMSLRPVLSEFQIYHSKWQLESTWQDYGPNIQFRATAPVYTWRFTGLGVSIVARFASYSRRERRKF